MARYWRSSMVVVIYMVLLVAVLAVKAEEEIKSVSEEETQHHHRVKASTYLTVTIGGNKISATTHGGKTFAGTGAKGTGAGVGYLSKKTGIYEKTTQYEIKAGSGVQKILFKDAKGATTGTWTGTIVPPVPASKGPGKFTK